METVDKLDNKGERENNICFDIIILRITKQNLLNGVLLILDYLLTLCCICRTFMKKFCQFFYESYKTFGHEHIVLLSGKTRMLSFESSRLQFTQLGAQLSIMAFLILLLLFCAPSWGQHSPLACIPGVERYSAKISTRHYYQCEPQTF